MILTFSRNLIIVLLMTSSTTGMHKAMIERISRAKILFFDSNPIGRIYTRFSKDISVLDLIVPGMFSLFTFSVFRTITVSITVIVVRPLMLIVVAFMLMFLMIIVNRATDA